MVRRESKTNSSGGGAGLLLPEIDEAQDLPGLLGRGDPCAGIAEDALAGVAGQEGQDAFLTTAAAGNVVFFQGFRLRVGRHGVEVQVERRPARQAGTLRLGEPGGQQALGGAVIELGRGGGEIGALGDHVEAGEQREALIVDQIHDVALTLGADQFEGQEGPNGLLSGDHHRAGQLRWGDHVSQADRPHQRHEEEASSQAC